MPRARESRDQELRRGTFFCENGNKSEGVLVCLTTEEQSTDPFARQDMSFKAQDKPLLRQSRLRTRRYKCRQAIAPD